MAISKDRRVRPNDGAIVKGPLQIECPILCVIEIYIFPYSINEMMKLFHHISTFAKLAKIYKMQVMCKSLLTTWILTKCLNEICKFAILRKIKEIELQPLGRQFQL